MHSPIFLIITPLIPLILLFIIKDNLQQRRIILISGFVLNIASLIYFLQETLHNLPVSYVLGSHTSLLGIELKATKETLIFIIISQIIYNSVIIFCLNKHQYNNSFFKILFISLFSINAIYFSNDIFNIYIFFEIMSISSFLLISYQNTKFALRSSLQYLFISYFCIFFFLLGAGIFYNYFGNFNISYISNNISQLLYYKIIKVGIGFLLVIPLMKAAIIPFHSWLPQAHSYAPHPVSVLLSGVIVKTGIVILYKLSPIWQFFHFQDLFLVLGVLSAVIGATYAVMQIDIKMLLSYSTISQMGYVLIGFSGISQDMQLGGFLHFVNHALFKSLLFFCACLLIGIYDSRNILHMRGLWQRNKFLSLILIIASFSIMGMPLFNGFISKTIISNQLHDYPIFYWLIQLTSLLTIASFFKILSILSGASKNTKFDIKYEQKLSITIIAILCLTMGIFYKFGLFNVIAYDYSYKYFFSTKSLIKAVIFFIIGYLISRLVIKQHSLLRMIGEKRFSFDSKFLLMLIGIIVLILMS